MDRMSRKSVCLKYANVVFIFYFVPFMMHLKKNTVDGSW